MSSATPIEDKRPRTAFDAQSDLEWKLMDLEAITDLMINVQASHMEGRDVSKFAGTLWRAVIEAQKSFDKMCKLQGKGGAS